MATQETQKVDEIIASRRAVMLGGTALAALALTGTSKAQTATAPTDNDILNFALNLEYLEGQFYTLATSGQTIDQVGIGIGAGTSATGGGTVTVKPTGVASCKVPFADPTNAAYATETAIEERKHVAFLRTTLGSVAVAQPNLDLYNSFIALGNLIGVPNFDPFANDLFFLLGAYIFEDVGVTAYHGAAGLITSKTVLGAAAGIHAVEAYHAGLVRTVLYRLDSQTPTLGIAGLTQKISAVRNKADGSTTTDDVGLSQVQVALNGTSPTYTSSTVVNADANSIGFARTTTQVLSIVTVGAAGNKGGFFPAGLNGTIK